jgi:hypothetical protein
VAGGAVPAAMQPPQRTQGRQEGGPAPASSQPPAVETLTKRLDGLDQRISALESQRVNILEFSFQSILVVLTILGLAAGIPFALLYGTKIATGDVAYFIAALLFAMVVLTIIWLKLWWRVQLGVRPPQRQSTPATSQSAQPPQQGGG